MVNDYTKQLMRCAKLTRKMPEGLKLLSYRPQVYDNGEFVDELHFSERDESKPDLFYAFAEKFGADMVHSELNDEYNEIGFEVCGVRCVELLDKEEL